MSASAASEMISQPKTRPISQEQLVAEVKGIYTGLVMVESKCIEVDSAQSAPLGSEPTSKLNNEQWQALIALHRTLLHEHHDFFPASQHPSGSPVLRKLARKYAMPARMWRHGIHSFLELLRHRLPDSLEHMLTLNYLANSMMALPYERAPRFEDTWIECLGDLGRYQMAIEDEDIRDREIWTEVSRKWSSNADDRFYTLDRLHHHLAILARPTAVQQLFYYTKSLCVDLPIRPEWRRAQRVLWHDWNSVILGGKFSWTEIPPFESQIELSPQDNFTDDWKCQVDLSPWPADTPFKKWIVHDNQTNQLRAAPPGFHLETHELGYPGMSDEWPHYVLWGGFPDDYCLLENRDPPGYNHHTLLSCSVQWTTAGRSMVSRFSGDLAVRLRRRFAATARLRCLMLNDMVA